MPVLVAPQPMHPPLRPRVNIPLQLLSPPTRYYTPDFVSPVHRLRSPIALAESCKQSFQPICSPSRRRTKPGSHSLRRRRPHPRVERTSHSFDQLPWISTLESAPEHVDPWNIADLSLIPDPLPIDVPESGLGPVRRRKTSLRSNPLGTNDPASDSPSSSESFPPLYDSDTSSFPPATPASRFIPSRVLFRNLMPVSRDDESPNCINIRSLEI